MGLFQFEKPTIHPVQQEHIDNIYLDTEKDPWELLITYEGSGYYYTRLSLTRNMKQWWEFWR